MPTHWLAKAEASPSCAQLSPHRNAGAVTLYERLGLRVFGENVTYLARAPGETSRPIVWYQLGLCADDASSDSGSSTPHSAQDGAPRKLRRVASS